jgi:hypothetical protein
MTTIFYQSFFNYNAFANVSSFSRVEVLDPADDFRYRVDPSSSRSISYRISPLYTGLNIHDTELTADRFPISRTECEIRRPNSTESYFPFPDIQSASYSSNGKSLNATLWFSDKLINPSFPLPIPNRDLYIVNIFNAENKTIEQFVSDRIDRLNKSESSWGWESFNYTTPKINTTKINLDIKKSPYFRLDGNPALKLVYRDSSPPWSPIRCERCEVTEILSIKNNKAYVISYIDKFQTSGLSNTIHSRISSMINSTKIGTNSSEIVNKPIGHFLKIVVIELD